MSHKEHALEQVSSQESLGVFKLAMVWAGFPFILAITITGSVFATSSDLYTATAAIIVGSLLMFFYIGLLGEIGWKERRSFSQIAQRIFGDFGYVLIAGLLSTLVLGWFTINTAMPAEILAASFHIPYWLVAIVLGIIFVAVTARGIIGMNMISNLSVPLFGALIFVAFATLMGHTGGVSGDGLASVGNHTLTFQEILAGVLASFADSGTLAPDFNRWATDRKASWLSVFAAFPLGFGFAMLAGVAFTAVLAMHGIRFDDPFQTANPVGYLIGLGGIFTVFAVVVAAVNQGSNATHCLYNSILGFSKLSGQHYVRTTLVVGTIGVIIAVTGVWAFLLDWLKIIGVLVPPIGAVVILAYFSGYYTKLGEKAAVGFTLAPWLSLASGWIFGLIVNFTSLARYLPVPIASFVISAIAMGFLVKAAKQSTPPSKIVLDEE
ncbi:cytosine permease [Acidithiobacillus ferrooxidans]|uniref:cytosine permease n=1 Tax=Acidithiobacillus ferrooxidans TaxID=920 RepID=UPI001C06B8E6|nr:cytosine permease [Acidithiobacillus ferrooxidans]